MTAIYKSYLSSIYLLHISCMSPRYLHKCECFPQTCFAYRKKTFFQCMFYCYCNLFVLQYIKVLLAVVVVRTFISLQMQTNAIFKIEYWFWSQKSARSWRRDISIHYFCWNEFLQFQSIQLLSQSIYPSITLIFKQQTNCIYALTMISIFTSIKRFWQYTC